MTIYIRELAKKAAREYWSYSDTSKRLEFYIESAIRAAVEQEREACATVADAKATALRSEGASITADVVLAVSDTIRARKDTP